MSIKKVQNTNTHVVVLGGGPCGLYTGRVLSAQGYHVTILDKGDRPGGLATSHKYGKNWYDLGVHMLHAFDKEIFEDVKQLMGKERIEVELDARIKWLGHHFKYPLKFQDMIKGIPFFTLCIHVFGLFSAQLKNSLFPKKVHNAEEALMQLYGKPLYKFFFKDFTHRYWGVHPRDLSATFVKTKMPKLSAVDVLKRVLRVFGIKDRGETVDNALSEETLHYSRTGAEAMTRHLAAAIVNNGGDVIQNAIVTQVFTTENKVTKIAYMLNNQLIEVSCDYCVSTIPISHLMSSLYPQPALAIINASQKLRYKPIVIYGLLVKKERCLDALYIYYRNRIFHRVGEPKNAGMLVDPADHSVLIVEMTCEKGDEKWNGDESVKQHIFNDLASEGICQQDDVVEVHISHYEYGYPIFALGFEEHLQKLKNHVADFKNLQTCGRQGAFTYPNMHSAMRMGFTAAQNIVNQNMINQKIVNQNKVIFNDKKKDLFL